MSTQNVTGSPANSLLTTQQLRPPMVSVPVTRADSGATLRVVAMKPDTVVRKPSCRLSDRRLLALDHLEELLADSRLRWRRVLGCGGCHERFEQRDVAVDARSRVSGTLPVMRQMASDRFTTEGRSARRLE